MIKHVWWIGGLAAAVLVFRPRAAGAAQLFDPMSPMPSTDFSPKLQAVAQAIARAEGFYLAGSIPQRAHNPGDLVLPNEANQGALGAEHVDIFSSDAEGWNRLYRQLDLIVRGKSHVYTLDMSIAQMAAKWTATQPAAWAANVAYALGVPATTTLRSVLL